MPLRFSSPTVLAVTLLVILYGIFAIPHAYFRHDDWVILANSANLAEHWNRLWHPTLFFPDERAWFFRPFFKLGTWICYRLFGYHYWAWLAALLAMTLAALALAADAIARLSGEKARGDRFALLFAAALPLHFPNLVWAGEGLMNCPQVLLLTLSFWATVRGRDALAWLAFVLSLGFKESSVFFVGFLGAAYLVEPRFTTDPRRWYRFAPIAVTGIVYLALRLGLVPLNHDYVPNLKEGQILQPLALFLGAMGFPIVTWIAMQRLTGREPLNAWLKPFASRAAYVPFFAACIAPCLAHPFFSPGWLLLPGFFACFAFALAADPVPTPRRQLTAAAVVLAISVAIVTVQLIRLDWWRWKGMQQAVHEILRTLPDDTGLVAFERCDWKKNQTTTLERVVGTHDSLQTLWSLYHPRQTRIISINCGSEQFRVPASLTSFVKVTVDFPTITGPVTRPLPAPAR